MDVRMAPPPPERTLLARVTGLPLLGPACGLVASVYRGTKDSHPYLRGVCEAAERRVSNLQPHRESRK